MSDAAKPISVVQRRLIKPLPAPGASKRVRKTPASQAEGNTEKRDDTEASTNVEATTPKARVTDLPPDAESKTPKQIPSLKLNDEPLPESKVKESPVIIDVAKDEELRKKLMEMRIYEQARPVVRNFVIPKRVKERQTHPPREERRMARVEAKIKTAPQPQISFGETATVFGTQGKCEVQNEAPVEPTSDATASVKKEGADTRKDVQGDADEDKGDSAKFKAIYRRQQRQKKERLGLSKDKDGHPAIPPPDPSLSLEERLERNLQLSQANLAKAEVEDGEDGKAKQLEAREKIKKLTYMMAKDIQLKRIPKSQLKAMAKGKTEQETAARMKILEMAMKIAKKQQEKDKEKAKAYKEPKQVDQESNDEVSKLDISVGVPKETEDAQHQEGKGKERAPGWSTLDETPPEISSET